MASNITTLVEKAKLGDADAFSTLYQMYYPKMKGICINILREDKADRKSTRLNSSHWKQARMPSSA